MVIISKVRDAHPLKRSYTNVTNSRRYRVAVIYI